MASQSVEKHRAAHQAFNRRDFDEIAGMMTEDFTYTDHPRGETFRGPDAFREGFLERWVASFSDAEVSDPTYLDAGNASIAQMTGRGTNDGPLGDLPATGKTLNFPLCEVMRFNERGQMVSGGAYYDQLTMLAQLGHVEAAEGVPGAR
jgi:steroid delta-isomerase-like uncharacterized protein